MSMQRMPSVGTVLWLQLEYLVRVKFVIGIAMLLGIYLLIAYGFLATQLVPPWLRRPSIAAMLPGMIALGGLAAVLTWSNEGPGNRRYHWSLPVARELHDLLRVIAGALWLVMLIAAFATIAWFLEAPIHRSYWLNDAPLFWLAMFLVPLLVYALATVPALLSGKPLLWIFGTMLVSLLLATRTVEKYAPPLATLGDALFSEKEPRSLGVALSGIILLAPWEDGRERYRVYRATADSVLATSPFREANEHSMREQLRGTPPYTPRQWLTALGVWYTIGLLGIALSLRARPNV